METLFENNTLEDMFSPLTEDKGAGILFTNNYDSKEYPPVILFALETASKKFNADAVYFRRFPDGRADMPQLYIFDYSNKKLTQVKRNAIHREMWNGYQVPAYCIVEKSSVSIYDSREKPKVDKDNYAKEIIKLAAKDVKTTFDSFADGLFWEEYNKNKHFKFEESAVRDLIQGLKKVYRSFQQNSGINKHIALKLLVQSLLIKYLEGRDEKSKSGYFAKAYFQKHFQCANFCDTIRKGKLLKLLDKLAEDFNGKVFQWDEDKDEEKNARKIIEQENIKELADYLDGDNKDNQYVIWRLYSFEHLPVEIISSVYEELLTNSKDIVYTPEMIVSTMVDECMPLSSPPKDFRINKKFKLADVSCGSGIFLVKAYKRLVQWWRYEQWKETGKLTKPSLKDLNELLTKNIYGVDIEQDAIHLSVFSLALAILDEVDLNPPTWEHLKFPDLSSNITTKDFFKFITNNPPKDFSLIIGNPPFNLKQENGKEGRKQYFKTLKKEIGYQSEIKIPDENPALHFLVQSMKLLKDDALLCLILPSGPLLYQKDLTFKQDFFSKYNLLQIIDFTKLADKLWGKKNVATAAVFMQKANPDNENVLHLVANRTVSNTNRLFLEFDYYDFHWITKEDVLHNLYIWKANLLGGGRIAQLIERLADFPTLKNYLKNKKKKGWVSGEGFIEKGDKNVADYITGKDFLPTEYFTEKGIDYGQVKKCNIEYFHRPRKEKLYTPPHLLIRKINGREKLVFEYTETYLTFTSDIYAIHAPLFDKFELQKLSKYIDDNSKTLQFYILSTSSRAKVNKATSLYNEDIIAIPYPENANEVKLSASENVILTDVIRFELNSAVQNIFVSIASFDDITDFSSTFCKTLNSIYQTQEKSFQLFKILDAGKYYALHFEYSSENIQAKTENTVDLEQYIEANIPSYNKEAKQIHIQRIMKVYGKDCVLLIKPKQLRYWLPSIALRDADEVFAEYYKSRYPDA